jgi:hypothetical protein
MGDVWLLQDLKSFNIKETNHISKCEKAYGSVAITVTKKASIAFVGENIAKDRKYSQYISYAGC